MKRYLVLIFVITVITGSLAVELPVRLGVVADIHVKGAGLGVAGSVRDRTFFQLLAGVSSNFTEPDWNDFFVTVKGHYRIFQEKRLALPIGVVTGYKYISNYDQSFSSVNAGLYSGIDCQLGPRQIVACHVGLKCGRKKYMIEHQSVYGRISYIETFREPLLYISCNYQILF